MHSLCGGGSSADIASGCGVQASELEQSISEEVSLESSAPNSDPEKTTDDSLTELYAQAASRRISEKVQRKFLTQTFPNACGDGIHVA
jgi:hypothetical protein